MDQINQTLSKDTSVSFKDLLYFATRIFGEPRVKGSHHVFKTPWKPGPGIPYLNFQCEGRMAKPAQVREFKKALKYGIENKFISTEILASI